MYDVSRIRIVRNPPHQLQWSARDLDDGRLPDLPLRLLGLDIIGGHHRAAVREPVGHFELDNSHEALRVAGLAQLATHALQAEGEAASIGRERVERGEYDRWQLDVAWERWRQGLGKRGTNGRGFESEITLRGCDDVGIASELGFRGISSQHPCA